MKIKVIKPAFYNLEYVKEGRILDFSGKKCPSWAQKIEDTKTKSDDSNSQQNENKQQNIFTQQDKNEPQANEQKVSPEVESYLERLLNEALDKNIYIENTDKKSVQEQIKELEKLLGYDKKESI